MDEHKKFLADRLLSEERPITYRQLSRALDVHANTAKCMLCDFHRYQNSLRAGSVHATYLVYGVRSAKFGLDHDDVEMCSSLPEPEPLSEAVHTKTLSLVGEQSLQELLADYQEVTSIHVYSLAPHRQEDLAILADVSGSVPKYRNEQDFADAAAKYGAILNANVRKRDRGHRPAVQAAAPSIPAKPKPKPATAHPEQASKVNEGVAETPSKDGTPSSSSRKNVVSAPKRGSQGGIMQSFAKAASKPILKPKQSAENGEEGTMALSDDGEADDSDMPPSKKADKDAEAAKNSRKEREEALRRMMEEDDNEEEPGDKDTDRDDEEMMEEPPEPEAASGLDSELKEHKEPAEVVSSSGDGRRRGKRRVMQKKRILDDQGYMVTIQESGWESFSEDEASQPPAKKATPTSTPSSSGQKAKKATGKAGQGNIMSFFARK